MSNFFWASLCLLYTTLRPGSDIGIIYLLLIPVTFLLTYFAVHSRKKYIENCPLTSMSDPLLIELKIRFKLIESDLLFYEGLKQADGAEATSPSKPGLDPAAIRQVLDTVAEMYAQSVRQVPKSCILQLFLGSFQLNQLGNRTQCLATHVKAQSLSPKLDEAYMIFRRQRLLNER
jgi:hypothetical protein